jgi:peptide deformylase
MESICSDDTAALYQHEIDHLEGVDLLSKAEYIRDIISET